MSIYDFDGWRDLETCRIWDWLACGNGNGHAEQAATEAAMKGDLDTLKRTIRAHLKARNRTDLLPLVDGMDADAIARELVEINGEMASRAKG